MLLPWGEVPQYFVENTHPDIIPLSTCELAQDEILRWETTRRSLIGSRIFTGKILCGQCGGVYGSKVWHSASLYRKVVWRCNHKYGKRLYCQTPHFSEMDIHQAFMRAWSAILADKTCYIADYEAEIAALTDVAFDKQTAILTAECAEAAALVQDCIAQNAVSVQNQKEYQKQYDELVAQYDSAKTQLEALAKEKQERIARKEKIIRFLGNLQKA
jgi:hypothetical protein